MQCLSRRLPGRALSRYAAAQPDHHLGAPLEFPGSDRIKSAHAETLGMGGAAHEQARAEALTQIDRLTALAA